MQDSPPLSLDRLRNAFAEMLKPQGEEGSSAPLREEASRPRSVVEVMLFVGRPDNSPMSARELAAALRGVSPAEIEAAVAELNVLYERDKSPYQITGSARGYRLSLREEYRRVRDKFYGRIREAKLSPAALEVLAVVAYNQPTTLQEIDRLRGRPSGPVLATLVRRQLAKLERAAETGQPPSYATTERFLRVFRLESLATLPRSEELEKV